MLVSESVLKWAMRFYPPLFFQRIWVTDFHKGFSGVQVKISKSIFNKNYNNSIFGGTIYAATDPFYPVLFYQVLSLKGYKIQAWSRSSSIRFYKPAISHLHFIMEINDQQIAACEEQLNLTGQFKKSYLTDIYDMDDKLCVSVIHEIFIRVLNQSNNIK